MTTISEELTQFFLHEYMDILKQRLTKALADRNIPFETAKFYLGVDGFTILKWNGKDILKWKSPVATRLASVEFENPVLTIEWTLMDISNE